MAEILEPGEPVNLAREPAFRLGLIQIYPSTLQVSRDGNRETLEPRVMQVLVALAQADGEVVTSDELIQRCWGGRIVGENAIHRVISRVRHVAATIGEGSFRIETIAKVGYRLIVDGEPSRAAAPVLSPTPRRTGHWLAPTMAAAIVVAVAAMGAWRWGSGDAHPTVEIVAAEGSAQGRSATLARGLQVDLSALPAAKAGRLALLQPPAPGRSELHADYLVRVSTDQGAGRLRADLTMTTRGSPRTLWSASFEHDARQGIDLRRQAAAALGAVLICASRQSNSGRLDPVTLQLYLASCGQASEDVDDGLLRRLRQVVARAPGFAHGWASLALAEARAFAEDPAAAEPAAVADHIRRARALDPNLGETYVAEALLIPTSGGWAERLRLYEQGIAVDPDFAALHGRRAFELTRVGRMQDAVRSARRAVALDPLSASIRDQLVSALAYSGQPAAAFAELARAERIWPGTRAMRALRYRMELRYGDPRAALRFHDQPDLFDMLNPPTDRVWTSFLRARIDPSPANVQRAVDTFMPRYPQRIMGLLQTLGHFGRVDEAYRLIEPAAVTADLRNGTEVLFRPQMKSLRDDRRFIRLAARLGLLDHWRTSGVWPDFCLDPDLPYSCREEAARIGPRQSGRRIA